MTPDIVKLEGRLVPFFGPEWQAHLDKEAQEYAERGGASLNMGNKPIKAARATKRTRRAVA